MHAARVICYSAFKCCGPTVGYLEGAAVITILSAAMGAVFIFGCRGSRCTVEIYAFVGGSFCFLETRRMMGAPLLATAAWSVFEYSYWF